MLSRLRHLGRRQRLAAIGGMTALATLALPGSAWALPGEDAVKEAAQWALEGTFEIPGSERVAEGFVMWLIAVPNFNETGFRDLASQGNLAALALITAIASLSAVRYCLAGIGGLDGGGAAAGFEGIIRTAGAALAILAWPWLFDHVIAIVNATSNALIGGDATDLSKLLALDQETPGTFSIVHLLFRLAAWGMIVALCCLKVFLIAWLAVLCAGMPFMLMLGALPELSWIPRNAGRAFVLICLCPIAWCFELLAAQAIRVDDLLTADSEGLSGMAEDFFLKPIVGLVIAYMMFKTPKHLRMGVQGAMTATVGAPASAPAGFLGRSLSYMVGHALAAQLPVSLGGRRQPDIERTAQVDAATGAVRYSEKHNNLTKDPERDSALRSAAAKTAGDEQSEKLRKENKADDRYFADRRHRLQRERLADARYADGQAHQAERERLTDERYADGQAHQTEREQLADARYADGLAHQAEREVLADARYADGQAHQAERERLTDERHATSEVRYAEAQAEKAERKAQDDWAWSPPAAETPRRDDQGRPGSGVINAHRADRPALEELAHANANPASAQQVRAAWDGLGSSEQQLLRDMRRDYRDAPDFRQGLADIAAAPQMDPQLRAGYRTLLAGQPDLLDELAAANDSSTWLP